MTSNDSYLLNLHHCDDTQDIQVAESINDNASMGNE